MERASDEGNRITEADTFAESKSVILSANVHNVPAQSHAQEIDADPSRLKGDSSSPYTTTVSPSLPHVKHKPDLSQPYYQEIPDSEPDEPTAKLEEDRTTRSRHRHNATTWHIWWREILGCLCVILALIALILVLHTADGQPLLQLPFNISINTLISIITTVVKVAAAFVLAEGISQAKWSWFHEPRQLRDFALYDNASRGPLGSVLILWHLRLKPVVTSIGALVTILLLIAEPLSQQLVVYEECYVVMQNMKALIPRAQVYDEHGSYIGGNLDELAAGLRLSMSEGLFSSNKPEVPWECETTNCTFSDYSSVGFCSTCVDASDRLLTIHDKNTNRFNVTLPFPHLNVTLRRNLPIENESFVVRNIGNGSVGMIAFHDKGSKGYQCDLYPCVHTYQDTKVTSGRLEEKVSERSGPMQGAMYVQDYSAYKMADLSCLDTNYPDHLERRAILKRLGYVFDDSTRWIPYNVSFDPVHGTISPRYSGPKPVPIQGLNPDTELYQGPQGNLTLTEKALTIIPAQCIYEMYNTIPTTMGYILFRDFFNGLLIDGASGQFITANGPVVAQAIYQGASANLAGRTSVLNYPDTTGQTTLAGVSDVMQNITDSITTYIRWHGNKNFSDAAVGVANHYAVCVRVRWGYIAYIAVLIVLLLGFFVGMTVETGRTENRARIPVSDDGYEEAHGSSSGRHHHRHDFKSSTLATVFHGLDTETQALLGDVGCRNDVAELEDRSKEVFVRLRQTDRGWKLSSVV